MKKILRECLPCYRKLVILLLIVTLLSIPLGLNASLSHASPTNDNPVNSGILKHQLAAQEGMLNLKLLGVTSYELTEIFHNIVKATPGVIKARRYHLNLNPDNPQACAVEWEITFTGTTPFALESEIYKQLKEIAHNDSAVHIVNGSNITLTVTELESLKAIKPLQATSQTLRFVQTRTFARNQRWQWSNQHHHYQQWLNYPNRGFE